MNAALAALLVLDLNRPRRLHYHCTTQQEIADQMVSPLTGNQEHNERTTAL